MNNNNIFTVSSESNFLNLLNRKKKTLVIVFVFDVKAKSIQNLCTSIIEYSKTSDKTFVLIDTSENGIPQYIKKYNVGGTSLLYFKNNMLKYKSSCSEKTSVEEITKKINEISEITATNHNAPENETEIKAKKINKIEELNKILNIMHLNEIQKLSLMKEIDTNLS